LTIYIKFFLTTWGLNEFWLRLLPLVSGCLLIFMAPLLMQSVLENKEAFIYSIFIATSPLLLFYSRYARPYSMLVLLYFLAMYFLLSWSRTRKKGCLGLCLVSRHGGLFFSFGNYCCLDSLNGNN
jgi:predicted membrane-bound mannosyltransferase